PPKIREVTKWGEVIHAEYLQRLRAAPGLAVLGHEEKLEFRLPGLDFPFRGKYDFLVEGHPVFLVRGLGLGEAIPPVLQPLVQQPEPVRFLIDVKSTGGFVVNEVAEQGARAADRAELMLYQHAAGVELGFLLYHDKQGSRREVLPPVYNEALLLAVRNWSPAGESTAPARPRRGAPIRSGTSLGSRRSSRLTASSAYRWSPRSRSGWSATGVCRPARSQRQSARADQTRSSCVSRRARGYRD